MKKLVVVAAIALALPLAAVAQTSANAPAKPAAKSAAKPAANTAEKKAPPKRQVTRRAAKAVEEVTPISEESDVVLTDEDLAVSKRVLTGEIKCELGSSVKVAASEKKTGFFVVTHEKKRYFMHPVSSRTGAIRLEDPKAEAMWLQLGNKSMLMSQKQGLRLADECQATEQAVMAEDMKKNPPKSLFEGADAPKK